MRMRSEFFDAIPAVVCEVLARQFLFEYRGEVYRRRVLCGAVVFDERPERPRDTKNERLWPFDNREPQGLQCRLVPATVRCPIFADIRDTALRQPAGRLRVSILDQCIER